MAIRKSKRAKALDITKAVKDKVWERDGGHCIICGNRDAYPNAHYIPRSQGGLGIEQNVVTLCGNFAPNRCHYTYDFGTDGQREFIGRQIEQYLKGKYPNWNEADLYYKKVF